MPFIQPKKIEKQISKEVDTEYQPVIDNPTIPLTVQCKQPGKDTVIYIHPDSPLVNEPSKRHQIFTAPLAQLEYAGIEWREVSEEELAKNKMSLTIAIEIFYSLKDIEFSFKSKVDYINLLGVLEVGRRAKIVNNAGDTLRFPYLVKDPVDNRWKVLTVRILDYSALLGAVSLKSYAKITGIKMDFKDNFTKQEKGEMYRMYIERPEEFDNYALGDCVLHEMMLGAEKLFDYICSILDVEPPEYYGMSTGTIVARIVSRAIAKKAGFKNKTITDNKTGKPKKVSFVELFSKACSGSHPSTIQQMFGMLSEHKENIPYVSMVDGGRAVNATLQRVVKGVLGDNDIGGCYANGLMNQLFAIGSPTKVTDCMTLREFFKKYEKQFIAGLWQARISTVKGYKLSFEQDLFVSKVEKKFTLWENSSGFDEDGFWAIENIVNGERIYDASMVLLTRQINQAILNHDLLQVCRKYWSNKEWSEFMDNTYIESALIYEKKNHRQNIDLTLLKGVSISKLTNVEVAGTKLFKIISMKDIVEPLLIERKKVQNDPTKRKKSPEDLICKLILNTIYGCIASQFFTNSSDGISNVVVGNNITARVRTLAWCMEKALYTQMSITDGGVHDLNKAIEYKYKSSQIFSDVYRGVSTQERRDLNFRFVPVLGYEIDQLTAKSEVITDNNENGSININQINWDFCKKTFPDLDIFSQDQFYFEMKSVHSSLVKHSKVDYRLDEGTVAKYALRGCKKVELVLYGEILKDKNGDPLMTVVDEGKQLFTDIENNKPTMYTVNSTKQLSFADWVKDKKSNCEIKKYSHLLPHDTISDLTRFFSITPLGCRFENMNEYKSMVKEYEKAKESENTELAVAEVAYKYGYPKKS